jgi:hypothetical protein
MENHSELGINNEAAVPTLMKKLAQKQWCRERDTFGNRKQR